MRVEVHSAADFLMNLLRVKHGKDLSDVQLEKFKGSLADLMIVRYQAHWYPDFPTKGSGYRCIRINGKMDPMIEQAGVAVGLNPRILRKMLPQELTLWIDPDEVAYRIGENGSICVLFDAVRSSPSSDLDSTGSDESVMDRVGRLDITELSVIDYLVDSTTTPIKTSINHHNQSPPLSPPYQHYNSRYNKTNHHQQRHHHNNNYNNNHHNNNNHQQNHNFGDNSMYHWESGLHNFSNFNKVRTQC